MNGVRGGWVLRVAFFALAITMVATQATAQRGAATFRQGDRVEVEEVGEWRKGTVAEVNARLKWIEVRLDDDGELPSNLPKDAREQFLTRPFPKDRVRALGERNTNERPRVATSRTWTDRSDKFRVDARFERLNGEKAVLVKRDGKRIEVPLDQLSDADADYVLQLDKAENNPFQELPDDSTVADSTATAELTQKADWRNVKQVRPQKFSKWAFVPAASATPSSLELATTKDVEIELREIPESQKFFEKVQGVYVSTDGRRAVIAREQGQVAHDKKQFLEVIDLNTGESVRLTPLPPKKVLLDVLPDEGLVMFRPEVFGSGSNTLLTIARLEAGVLKPVASWEPYRHEDWGPRRDIDRAWFLGAERVLTANEHGQALTVWDVAATKALMNIPVGNSMLLKMSLSPDRNLLAVIMEQGIALIDLTAGRHVATLPAEGRKFERVEFGANCRQLVGVSDEGLTLWDLIGQRHFPT